MLPRSPYVNLSMQNVSLMKFVRREGDGYAINPLIGGRPTSLCDVCPRSSRCQVAMTHRRSEIAKSVVYECRSFIPVITFSPPIIGLQGRFNTMRMGRAWMEKLVIGESKVALVNGRTFEIIGLALVENLAVGFWDAMVELHAAENHLCNDIEVEDPIETVGKVLAQSYGRFRKPSSELTVINLRRIDGENRDGGWVDPRGSSAER